MRALKRQLKNAEKHGARVSIIVESELPGKIKWKNMESREQIEIEDDRLLEYAEEDSNNDKVSDA